MLNYCPYADLPRDVNPIFIINLSSCSQTRVHSSPQNHFSCQTLCRLLLSLSYVENSPVMWYFEHALTNKARLKSEARVSHWLTKINHRGFGGRRTDGRGRSKTVERDLALCLEEGTVRVRTAGGFSASLIFQVLALISDSWILMNKE